MSQHNLQFLNPEHHAGLNVTVRLGVKWKDRVSRGDIVKIVKTDEEDKLLGFGVIWDALVCPFHSISHNLLAIEHDPTCCTLSGLAAAMTRAYGDEFNEDSKVTVLVYTFQPVIPNFLTKIIKDLLDERGYQESKWSQDFDSMNTMNDWITYVNIYMARGAEMGNRGNVEAQRSGMLKACCLLLSSLYCCDLNNGFAPRHYEHTGKS